jgi:predicted glycosyltransferase
VRVLFLSSHVGLGHVARDVVIAGFLEESGGVSVEWCTAEPALGFVRRLGLRVADGCVGLESFSRPIEDLYNGRVQGVRELAGSLSILRRNYEAVSSLLGRYDLVFADEFWEVVYGVPDSVREGIVFATDIVYKPYTPAPRDFILSLILNRYFKRVLTRYRRLVYLNDPDMLRGRRWYPLIGGRVDSWLRRHSYIAGLATSYRPGGLPSRGDARRRLGVGDDEFLVVVAVGGTSAGSRRVLDCIDSASPSLSGALREETGRRPRIIAIPGPRTPWRPTHGIIEVPDDPSPPGLHDYYAAADLFISRAGRTTTADLLCAGVPAVLIPIQGHFEQEEIARHMASRHGYTLLPEDACTVERLLHALKAEMRHKPQPPGELCRGSEKAALLIRGLLEPSQHPR